MSQAAFFTGRQSRRREPVEIIPMRWDYQRLKHNAQNNTWHHCFLGKRRENRRYLSQPIAVTLLASNRIVANLPLSSMAFKQLPDHPILVFLDGGRGDKIWNVTNDINLKFCHQSLQVTPPPYFSLQPDIRKGICRLRGPFCRYQMF